MCDPTPDWMRFCMQPLLLGSAQTALTTVIHWASQGFPLSGCWLTDCALRPLGMDFPSTCRINAAVSSSSTQIITHLHDGALAATTVKLPWSVLFLCVQLTAETTCLY